jgi:transcriptional regulator with XRE-family HTH domain
MNYPEKIGKAIIRLRNARGISQEKMALEAKIDRRYMSDIENGKRNISIDILCKISDFFDLPISDFLSRVEDTTQYNASNDELKEWLVDQGYENSIVLENPSYRNAVVGVSEEGRVIYSARIILEDMMLDEGMDYEDALDHFNYNLLRSLPYMGEMAPIIQYDIYPTI